MTCLGTILAHAFSDQAHMCPLTQTHSFIEVWQGLECQMH